MIFYCQRRTSPFFLGQNSIQLASRSAISFSTSAGVGGGFFFLAMMTRFYGSTEGYRVGKPFDCDAANDELQYNCGGKFIGGAGMKRNAASG